jgi:hypothetical protein
MYTATAQLHIRNFTDIFLPACSTNHYTNRHNYYPALDI